MEMEQLCQLVTAAQSGDRYAMGQLITEFEPLIRRIGQKRLRGSEEIDELVQDVSILVIRYVHTVASPKRFAGWIRSIATNAAINRSQRRPWDSGGCGDALTIHGDSSENSLVRMIHEENNAMVWQGLSRLKDLHRRTLIAHYFEEQSLESMSVRFQAPLGTIKSRLHTARARLGEVLSSMQGA